MTRDQRARASRRAGSLCEKASERTTHRRSGTVTNVQPVTPGKPGQMSKSQV